MRTISLWPKASVSTASWYWTGLNRLSGLLDDRQSLGLIGRDGEAHPIERPDDLF